MSDTATIQVTEKPAASTTETKAPAETKQTSQQVISQTVKDAFSQPAEKPAEVVAKDDKVETQKATDKIADKTLDNPPEKSVRKSLLDRKATEKKADVEADVTGPEDSFELPDNADEAKKSQFAEMKKLMKATRREKTQLETQIETLRKAAPADTAAMDELKLQNQALSDRLAILDLQSHPDFHREFVEPRKKAISEANEILAYNGKEGIDMAGLLSKPQKDFNATVSELTKEMNGMDANAVQGALRSAYRLSSAEKQALSKSSELSTALQNKSAQHQKQAFEETWSKLGPEGEFLVTIDAPDSATAEEKQEIEAYNQAVAGVRNHAETLAFGRMDERGAASLSAKAAILDFIVKSGIPRMEHEYQVLVENNRALAEELKAIKGQRTTGPVAGDLKGKGGEKPKTIADAVQAVYQKA